MSVDINILESAWVEKYRPHTLNDIVLPEKTRRIIEDYVEKGIVEQNLFLCSRPGQGKTSLAKMLAYDIFNVHTLYVNASDENNVETVRSKITDFAQTLSLDGRFKLVILDECDNFANKTSQKILRGLMEETASTTRFILTANYSNNILDAIKSRCVQLDINPPKTEVLKRMLRILKAEGVKLPDDKRQAVEDVLTVVNAFFPDVRSVVKHLQLSVVNKDGEKTLSVGQYSVDKSFSEKILSMVLDKNAIGLREFILTNELDFNGDYHALLSDFLRMVMDSEVIEERYKVSWTIMIVNYLSRFGNLTDPELICIACLWDIIKSLG